MTKRDAGLSDADIGDMLKILNFTISAKNYTARNYLPVIPEQDRENSDKILDLIDAIPASKLIEGPLHKAIYLRDKETTLQIINKDGVSSADILKDQVLPKVISNGNGEIAAIILQKMKPEVQQIFEKDIKARFGSDVNGLIAQHESAIQGMSAAIEARREAIKKRAEELRTPEHTVQLHEPEIVTNKQIAIQ